MISAKRPAEFLDNFTVVAHMLHHMHGGGGTPLQPLQNRSTQLCHMLVKNQRTAILDYTEENMKLEKEKSAVRKRCCIAWRNVPAVLLRQQHCSHAASRSIQSLSCYCLYVCCLYLATVFQKSTHRGQANRRSCRSIQMQHESFKIRFRQCRHGPAHKINQSAMIRDFYPEWGMCFVHLA